MDPGNSVALRGALSERMGAGRRPVGWVACTSDTGLRTERVDAPEHDAAQGLDVLPLQGKLVRNLSSGERQRVRIAAALAPGMQDIALDEPTRHLDLRYVEALGSILERRQQEGASILACDARTELPAELFQVEMGRARDPGGLPTPARAAAGRDITLAVPTPFLLGAPRSRSGRPIELVLRQGDLISLEGPNGSGKSSLLEAMRAAAERDRISAGLARQDLEVHIFDRTPRLELEDVVAAWQPAASWLDHAIGRRAEGAAERPDYAPEQEVVDVLADRVGLARWLDRSVGSLPLGALALLGTAVALVLGRELVLLDEPTQGLDLNASRTLARVLAACANAGARVVVATHDPEILRVANGHWRLEAGTLFREQPPSVEPR